MERALFCIFCLLAISLSSPVSHASAGFRSIAFYYGPDPPVKELQSFDLVVFDPDHGPDPSAYRTRHSEAVAYVSIGEADPKRAYSKRIPKEWAIGENSTWGTLVLDQANPEWQNFFLADVIEPLWQKGYRGFFLDTVDSYRLASPEEGWPAQTKGLIAIVRSIRSRHPEARIILNRGFEIVPSLGGAVDAVAAESIFQQWDQQRKSYGAVPGKDREWLLGELNSVRKHGIPVIAIDYVQPDMRDLARETARRISDLGFIPWVTDSSLSSLGIGSIEVMPRRILGLYDSSEAADQAFTLLHRMAAMPLNYLGYMLELHDVRKPLPADVLTGRYAGILLWTNSALSGGPQKLNQWLLRQIDSGMRVLFLDNFGFPATSENLRPFGLDLGTSARAVSGSRIVLQDAAVGFEMPPLPRMDSFLPITARDSTPLLEVENSEGSRSTAVAVTRWGGYALAPYTLDQLPNGQTRWVVNPFILFSRALRLPDMPVPDTTTENGRRLMMVHVDGDGFVERARWGSGKSAGEVAYQEIFSRYRVPATVSIIQGEIAPDGLYGKMSGELEPIARKIFALPWVEIASHSFSHPFYWDKAEQKSDSATYHLEIPGYSFDLDREINGSVDYINRNLAPEGKRCRVFLWTGNCLPSEGALAMAGSLGLASMNGGMTIMTESQKTLTYVAPLGIQRGAQFQVYAPNQNENVYTNLWTGPFYGYERAIETFRLTDSPRRLKPIDIYFHFYSASRKASLAALKKVFDWSLGQPVFNIHASGYVERAQDFDRTVIARYGDGWLVRNSGALRELRIPAELGFPDIDASDNVAGFSSIGDARHIHLGPAGESLVRLGSKQPAVPYLREANAAISRMERSADRLSIEFAGAMPLNAAFGGMNGWTLSPEGQFRETSRKDAERTFTSPQVRGTLVIQKNP
jgi:uncharacterized protein (TIGR01370 family)